MNAPEFLLLFAALLSFDVLLFSAGMCVGCGLAKLAKLVIKES